MLFSRAKTSAEQYSSRGACSITDRLYKANRLGMSGIFTLGSSFARLYGKLCFLVTMVGQHRDSASHTIRAYRQPYFGPALQLSDSRSEDTLRR
jgi:hypothetical protein